MALWRPHSLNSSFVLQLHRLPDRFITVAPFQVSETFTMMFFVLMTGLIAYSMTDEFSPLTFTLYLGERRPLEIGDHLHRLRLTSAIYAFPGYKLPKLTMREQAILVCSGPEWYKRKVEYNWRDRVGGDFGNCACQLCPHHVWHSAACDNCPRKNQNMPSTQ